MTLGIQRTELAQRPAQARPSHADEPQGHPVFPDKRLQQLRVRIAQIGAGQ